MKLRPIILITLLVGILLGCQSCTDGGGFNVDQQDTTQLNQRDSEGKTPLFRAYVRRDFREMRNLIERGADINIPDKPSGSARSVVYYLTGDDDRRAVDLFVWLYESGRLSPDLILPKTPTPYLYYVALSENYNLYERLLEIGYNPWIKGGGRIGQTYAAIAVIRDIRYHYALLKNNAFDRDISLIKEDYLYMLLIDRSVRFPEWGRDRHLFLLDLVQHEKFRANSEIIAKISEGRSTYGWE